METTINRKSYGTDVNSQEQVKRIKTNTADFHACNIPPAVYDILIAKTNWLRTGSRHVTIKDVLDDIVSPFLEMSDDRFREYLRMIEPLIVSHPGRSLGWKRVYIKPEIQADLKGKLFRHGGMKDREQVGNTTKGVFPSVVIAAAIVADFSEKMPKSAHN